jgi:hypothetical protein
MCSVCAELVLFAYATILCAFNLSEGFGCHEFGRRVITDSLLVNASAVGQKDTTAAHEERRCI